MLLHCSVIIHNESESDSNLAVKIDPKLQLNDGFDDLTMRSTYFDSGRETLAKERIGRWFRRSLIQSFDPSDEKEIGRRMRRLIEHVL